VEAVLENSKVEALLKAIPAGWNLSFTRPMLRPDVIEMKIGRPDGVAMAVKTTGALLLDKPNGDFLSSIRTMAGELMKHPGKASKN
jgi:hypothetical protein